MCRDLKEATEQTLLVGQQRGSAFLHQRTGGEDGEKLSLVTGKLGPDNEGPSKSGRDADFDEADGREAIQPPTQEREMVTVLSVDPVDPTGLSSQPPPQRHHTHFSAAAPPLCTLLGRALSCRNSLPLSSCLLSEGDLLSARHLRG